MQLHAKKNTTDFHAPLFLSNRFRFHSMELSFALCHPRLSICYFVFLPFSWPSFYVLEMHICAILLTLNVFTSNILCVCRLTSASSVHLKVTEVQSLVCLFTRARVL